MCFFPSLSKLDSSRALNSVMALLSAKTPITTNITVVG